MQKADLDVLGGNFREVTAETKRQLNISYGLEVTKISNGKLKDRGMVKGFVIQRVNATPMKTQQARRATSLLILKTNKAISLKSS